MLPVYNYFIPESFLNPEGESTGRRERAIVIISLSLFIFCLGPIFFVFDMLRENYMMGAINLLLAPTFLVAPFALRYTKSLTIATHLMLSILCLISIALSFQTGYFQNPFILAGIVIPLFGVFLAGINVGVIWFGITVVVDIALFIILSTYNFAPSSTFANHSGIQRLVGIIAITMGGLAVAILYERAKNRTLHELEATNEALVIAERDAQQASIAKSAFLANMSHEIRTPLNTIIGYSEMISEDFEDLEPEDLKEDVERVYKAGKHLLSLLNDILDLSKIEAGKMDLYMEPVKVQELIDDVSSTSESLATANQNELKVIVKDIPEYVLADQTKLRQTLFNLLSNACKFTEKGSVTLTVDMETDESENDWLTFEVEDTGIGITPEQMKNLFQNFSQGDSSTTKKFGGTGLGLALSRRFCEMMGGTLTVSSVPDEGSTFTAKLPHRTTAMLDHKSQSSDQLTTKPSTGNGQTILVIDDEPDALDLLTRFLTKQGFNVVTSSTGKEGLKIAKQIHPMVIILDVIMPGINGWQLLTSIKSDDEICDIPVVMLSILDEGKKGFALGASEYMTKPVNPTRLIEVIHRFKKDTPLSVMVVEDDPATRDILQRTLHKNDCTVYEAENGAIALDLLETKTPSLILLDLMMPEVDGFTFLHELRQKEAHAHTPVIVLTAKELTNEEKDLLNGASQRILAKGATELDTLFNEIHHQVNQHIQ